MGWEMRQHLLGQLIKYFSSRALRKLNTQCGMINTSSLPLLEQSDQTVTPCSQHITPVQRRARILGVIDKIDPLIGHVRTKRTICNEVSPSTNFFRQMLRPSRGMRLIGVS